MNISDFSIAFQQKFDFGGKPYRFNKIDYGPSDKVTELSLGNYASYTASQQQNVMCVLSDNLVRKDPYTLGVFFSAGEVVYLSTLINYIKTAEFSFGLQQENFNNVLSFDTKCTSLFWVMRQLSGTIYIFDFNDNPIDM